MLSGAQVTRLAIYGGIFGQYGSFAGKTEQEPPVVPVSTTPPGGGRVIGWAPEAPAKRTVKVKWTDDHEKELIKRLKAIDDDFEEKRKAQYRELLEILRSAIHLGNQVSFSGFDYLTVADIKKAKRKVQIEEENAIILALISEGSI